MSASVVNHSSIRNKNRGMKRWPLLLPSVSVLLVWMIVPLVMTIWYSLQNYNLQSPPAQFGGLSNFE